MRLRTLSGIVMASLLSLLSAAPAFAATKYLWGQTGSADAGGGESTASVLFHRKGNRVTQFGAVVPLRCVSVDSSVQYISYSLSRQATPSMTVRSNGRARASFVQAEGDALLNDVSVAIQGRFRTARRATFTVTITTDHAPGDQSACTGTITLTNVRRGARVS